MSGTADTERLYAAVEEAAGLLDIACPPERMRPLLTAFQDVLADPVVFNTVTKGPDR
ncbi:hypothetical protein OHU34_43305 [Streptomyces sp. NBC_00080]|uniref:hypothetical protein n=1 Tax=unclassified Streptomyces TaxID=2593676 RepID=UPI001171DB9F|nr:hypothetical protein [Streptomyces sp. SLBN-115]TQJ37099.1 hypothetical protein FBY34_8609 [Streptomyces sp. SLBN-115]